MSRWLQVYSTNENEIKIIVQEVEIDEEIIGLFGIVVFKYCCSK